MVLINYVYFESILPHTHYRRVVAARDLTPPPYHLHLEIVFLGFIVKTRRALKCGQRVFDLKDSDA